MTFSLYMPILALIPEKNVTPECPQWLDLLSQLIMTCQMTRPHGAKSGILDFESPRQAISKINTLRIQYEDM